MVRPSGLERDRDDGYSGETMTDCAVSAVLCCSLGFILGMFALAAVDYGIAVGGTMRETLVTWAFSVALAGLLLWGAWVITTWIVLGTR